MQVLILPVFNALLLAIQCYEYTLGEITLWCLQGIQQGIVDDKSSNVTVPALCDNSQIVYFEDPQTLYISQTASQAFLTSYSNMYTAFSLTLAILIVILLVTLAMCWLAFHTYKCFRWSIYRINGADIHKRNIITRYHVFILALKLNIFFAICDFAVFASQRISLLIYKPEVIIARFTNSEEEFQHGGYAEYILMLASSMWCLLSACLFFFVGIRAIRMCNYWLMGLLLAVYIVQVFVQGRVCLYLFQVAVPTVERRLKDTDFYLGVIVALEMAIDIFIILMGSWVMYDFRHGLSQLVNEIYENRPWIFRKKPDHLNAKERFVID